MALKNAKGKRKMRVESPIPNAQSPIPNPQSPIPNPESPNPQSLVYNGRQENGMNAPCVLVDRRRRRVLKSLADRRRGGLAGQSRVSHGPADQQAGRKDQPADGKEQPAGRPTAFFYHPDFLGTIPARIIPSAQRLKRIIERLNADSSLGKVGPSRAASRPTWRPLRWCMTRSTSSLPSGRFRRDEQACRRATPRCARRAGTRRCWPPGRSPTP